MGISHEHTVQGDARDILHLLPTKFDSERLLGPRQVVTVLLTLIREECSYGRGIALAYEQHGDVFTLNRAVRMHLERRVLFNGNRTVVLA